MAHKAYAKFTGADQKDIAGDAKVAPHDDGKWTECLEVSAGVAVQFDHDTGLPTGKRSHSPVRLIAEIGSQSPLLFVALCNNEVISECTIAMYNASKETGATEQHYSIVLRNARIVAINQWNPDASVKTNGNPLEEVTLTAEEVEWRHEITSASHVDNWTT